ncbi:class I SAM-dependent methyltransferase [Streptomyces sp. NPDC058877]|uniref:class I SAM-dependent methyltransferase n=1 Tax=unclassified Streptomyces TaxID=2593676 RepID=UPI0036BCB04B
MSALDLPGGSLGGVLAWYSTVHMPEGEPIASFREFHRVVAPGGYALVAFEVGDERVRLEQAYGHGGGLDVYRRSPDRVAGLLASADPVESARLVREPDPAEKTPPAFLLARKARGRVGSPRGAAAPRTRTGPEAGARAELGARDPGALTAPRDQSVHGGHRIPTDRPGEQGAEHHGAEGHREGRSGGGHVAEGADAPGVEGHGPIPPADGRHRIGRRTQSLRTVLLS